MPEATRCGHCGATMTEADRWCSLCLTPVAPAAGTPGTMPPPTGPAVAPPAPAPPAAGAAAPTPVPAMPPPSGPAMVPSADPDEWLALLAAQEGQGEAPLVAAGRRHRFAIMVGGAVAIIVILTIAMVLASMIAG